MGNGRNGKKRGEVVVQGCILVSRYTTEHPDLKHASLPFHTIRGIREADTWSFSARCDDD